GSVWLVAALVLPCVVVYHPAYIFPLALGPFALAGIAAGRIYEALCAREGRLAAGAALACVCAFDLPGLVSHYRDGSRHDFRTAAQYIAQHRQAGDQVATTAPELLGHYADACRTAVAVSETDPVPALERLSHTGRRLWIVLPSDRGGLPEAV